MTPFASEMLFVSAGVQSRCTNSAQQRAKTEPDRLDYAGTRMERENDPGSPLKKNTSGEILTKPDADAPVGGGSSPEDRDVRSEDPLTAKRQDTQPPRKWQVFGRGVLHIDAAKMEPWIALRNAMGVAIPLAVGIAIGMPLGGLAVASGALNVSYSDGHDPYKERARRLLASSVLCSIAVMAGGLAGHHNATAGALIAVWAFGSGMA